MNLAFLGDALDHWKGSLFESLQRVGILKNFTVDPMASDMAAWKPADFSLYATLLRIDPSQIVMHTSTLADRQSYFAEIRHPGDLFLDPDTGVSTGTRGASVQHVAASEIATLVGSSDRLLAIYQHVRAQRVSERVETVCRVIRSEMQKSQWCSYESGTVAMIFVARKRQRIAAVARHFSRLLGQHAAGRIRVSRNGREV